VVRKSPLAKAWNATGRLCCDGFRRMVDAHKPEADVGQENFTQGEIANGSHAFRATGVGGAAGAPGPPPPGGGPPRPPPHSPLNHASVGSGEEGKAYPNENN
jgi:hypothetical protein